MVPQKVLWIIYDMESSGVRDRRQILLLMLSEFERMNNFFPLKLSENQRFFNDFREIEVN